MNNLRNEIIVIINAIADFDGKYWGDPLTLHLDQEAVITDIMAAVVEHDGEVMEVYGEA